MLKLFQTVYNGYSNICKCFSFFGALGLAAIAIMVTIDVIMRNFFEKPLIGTYEVIQFVMIIVIFFAIPYCQVKKQHVAVTIFSDLLKGKLKHILSSFTNLLSVIIYFLIAYTSFKATMGYWTAKQVSLVLLWPQWPFILLVAIGTTLYTGILLLDFLQSLVNLSKSKRFS